jgi:hypothetical protein
MHLKLISSVSFVVALAVAVAQAAETKWYTTRSCAGSAALDYQNLSCNVCVDPANGMFSTFISCDSMSMNIDNNFNWKSLVRLVCGRSGTGSCFSSKSL